MFYFSNSIENLHCLVSLRKLENIRLKDNTHNYSNSGKFWDFFLSIIGIYWSYSSFCFHQCAGIHHIELQCLKCSPTSKFWMVKKKKNNILFNYNSLFNNPFNIKYLVLHWLCILLYIWSVFNCRRKSCRERKWFVPAMQRHWWHH